MYKSLLTILLLFACLAVQANPDSLVSNQHHAMLFNEVMSQEKIYLHLDNTGYFDGETIRFKAYVLRSDSESYTDISRVLYVELLNPSGDVIATRKCAIVDGQANGEIKLEKVFGAGYYEIRAYTRYMTNWGNAACFSRIIPIFDTPKQDGDYSNRTIEDISHRKRLPNYRAGGQNGRIGIYPEGGRMVKGLRRRSLRRAGMQSITASARGHCSVIRRAVRRSAL